MGNIKPDPVGRAAGKDAYAHKLYLSDFLREPTIRAAIGALQFSLGTSLFEREIYTGFPSRTIHLIGCGAWTVPGTPLGDRSP